MTLLSIIIVTYNSEAMLTECLRSILDVGNNLAVEIIIVDNGSQDATLQRVRELFPQVQLIANSENLGFAAANNIGLKVAQGKYLLLLNPDVVVKPNSFQSLITFLEQTPSVGIVGPRTFTPSGKVALSAFGRFSPFNILWQYWGLGILLPYYGVGQFRRQCEEATQPFPVVWLQGHCLMFRRTVYEQIGGLDEGLFLFAEEPDFCERASEHGWLAYYVPEAEVFHYESITVSRFPLLKMLHYHISILYYFRKRGASASVLLLKLGFTIELGFKLFLRVLQNIVRPSEIIKAKISAYPQVIRRVWQY